jgi:hypothetical protein
LEINDLVDPDILDRILSGNKPTEAEQDFNDQHLEQVSTLAAQYRSCFNSRAGRAVLAHLHSITIAQPCFVPGVAFHQCDGLSAEQNGFMREGQNSLVREIERYRNWEDPRE